MSRAGNTVFALLMGVEEDLRSAVTQCLADHPTPLSTDEASKAGERLERDQGPNAPLRSWTELLYYLDLGQKIEVLNRSKEPIARTLGLKAIEIARMTATLTSLIPIRNRVCHGRPLEEEDYSLVVSTVSELLSESAFPFDELARVFQRLRTASNDYPYTLTVPAFWNEGEQRIHHNLPTADFEDTGFVGRDKDRRNVSQLLAGAYPVINITGEGGLGKTSLALMCLYDLIERGSTPYDAIIWTTLKRNRLTVTGVQEIVGSLGSEIDALRPVVEMFEPAGTDLESPDSVFDSLIGIMTACPILLAIDNLETIDVHAIGPLLPRIPHPSKLLLTSRREIGSFEAPYALEPLVAGDAVQLLRRVARLMNVEELTRRADDSLTDICSKLFFNPLLIRWFVEGYSAGHSIPGLLNSTAGFKSALRFCFQNVYERLSPENLTVLRILSQVPDPLSEVEIALLAGIRDIDAVRSSLRYLQGSNLLQRARDSYGAAADLIMWAVTDFARLYVDTEDRPGVVDRRRITEQHRALIIGREQAQGAASDHSFRSHVIGARTTDEVQVMRILRRAQDAAHQRDYKAALARVQEAELLQPSFFEVYRVAGQVRAAAGDWAGAEEDFRRAMDLAATTSQPLLVYYAQFLRARGDIYGALELLQEPVRSPDAAPQLVCEFAWLHVLASRPRDAIQLFDRVGEHIMQLGGTERAVYVTQHAIALRELAESVPLSAIRDGVVPIRAALQTLARACPVIAIDRSVVGEGQRCFQLAAQIVATTKDPALWKEFAEAAATISQFFPLLAAERQGTDLLERELPTITSTEGYQRLINPDLGRTAGEKINGTLQRVRAGQDYGFIRGADGRDYFVHRTVVRAKVTWEDLWDRDPLSVQFVPGERAKDSTRAPKASEVTLTEVPAR